MGVGGCHGQYPHEEEVNREARELIHRIETRKNMYNGTIHVRSVKSGHFPHHIED